MIASKAEAIIFTEIASVPWLVTRHLLTPRRQPPLKRFSLPRRSTSAFAQRPEELLVVNQIDGMGSAGVNTFFISRREPLAAEDLSRNNVSIDRKTIVFRKRKSYRLAVLQRERVVSTFPARFKASAHITLSLKVYAMVSSHKVTLGPKTS